MRQCAPQCRGQGIHRGHVLRMATESVRDLIVPGVTKIGRQKAFVIP